MVPRLEALLDAIMEQNGSRDPASPAYQKRNPLYVPDYHLKRRDLRVFRTFRFGYQVALRDLRYKCLGKAHADLPSHDLLGLVRILSLPDITASRMAKFLQAALNDRAISAETRLEYFLL